MRKNIFEDEQQFLVNMGKLLRISRINKSLTQTDMGNIIEVTFQQIQKYENGKNRISLYYLMRWAEAVQMPVSYFFSEKGIDANILEIGKRTLCYIKELHQLPPKQRRAITCLITSILEPSTTEE